RLSSSVYITLAQGLFALHEYDDFNFLYLYRRHIFDGMPIGSDGVFLCTEIFVRARDRGARIAQVQAQCLPRRQGGSRVYRPAVIAKTMAEMSRFWWRRRGESDAPRFSQRVAPNAERRDEGRASG